MRLCESDSIQVRSSALAGLAFLIQENTIAIKYTSVKLTSIGFRELARVPNFLPQLIACLGVSESCAYNALTIVFELSRDDEIRKILYHLGTVSEVISALSSG